MGIEFLWANCNSLRKKLDSVLSSDHIAGVGEAVRVLRLTSFLCALFNYSYHFLKNENSCIYLVVLGLSLGMCNLYLWHSNS